MGIHPTRAWAGRRGRRANRQAVAKSELNQPRKDRLTRTDGEGYESAEPLRIWRRPSRRRRNWVNAVDELSGVHEDGMPRMNGQRKHGTSRGLLMLKRTAMGSRLSAHR